MQQQQGRFIALVLTKIVIMHGKAIDFDKARAMIAVALFQGFNGDVFKTGIEPIHQIARACIGLFGKQGPAV